MHIYIFGDSNSWGYSSDGKGSKYELRWPVVMLQNLQKIKSTFSVIEDSLPGRTTDLDDPQDGEFLNGASNLKSSLLAQSPINHSIIMLGTNDLKSRFNKSAKEIAKSLIDLANITLSSKAGKGGWHDENSPSVSIICPPILGEQTNNPDWNDETWRTYKQWEGGYEKSKILAKEIQLLCNAKNIHFINSNNYIKCSKKDPIHWDEEAHLIFGKTVADILLTEIF
jgi:lysophospholipase L1-like esterase|tara:strand:- start:201 stop:875 length:675 start_codon:yes stop_codon:yes gene_type:complete